METAIDQLIAWSKDLNVLYVEDDISLREEVSIFLSDIFKSVDLAVNGREGLEKLALHPYDIVITDIKMPVMDGIEMIENIKKLYPAQPILVTSAHNEVEYLIKLINLGVENFITKPLQSEQVFRVLHKIVEHINQKKELAQYAHDLEEVNQKLKKLTHTQAQNLDLKTSRLNAYQEAVDKATIVMVSDIHGIIKDVNENFCKATGYTEEEVIGQKHSLMRHPSTSDALYQDLWQTILAKKIWQGTFINQTKALTSLYHYTTIVPILDNQGEIVEFISIIQDLTQLYESNKKEAQHNIEQALQLKERDILKHIPFPSALISNELIFGEYNRLFEDMVMNHIRENLLGKLTSHDLLLKELVTFEEMDVFTNIEAIKSYWPYEGDITFKGTLHSVGEVQEVLVKVSYYYENLYLVCIVTQEDFELCCQVHAR